MRSGGVSAKQALKSRSSSNFNAPRSRSNNRSNNRINQVIDIIDLMI